MQRRRLVSFVPKAAVIAAGPFVLSNAFAQEPGIGANTMAIGGSAALTGPLAGFGLEMKAGVDAAFGQINAKGGIAGRKLQFNLLDDGYAPQRTQENLKKLMGEGSAFALLSVMGTPNNAAVTGLIEEAAIPHIAPLTGAGSIRKAEYKNLFHVRAGYPDETRRLVQQLVSMGIKDLAIVYMDNGFGKEVLTEAVQTLTAAGVKPVAQIALATDGKNVDAAVQAALAAKVGAVFVATAGAASTLLIAALRKASPRLPVAGLSVALTDDGIRKLGEAASGIAITMVFPDPNRTRLQLVRDYQLAMKASGRETFSLGSLEAYINARVLAEGLTRAGRDVSRAKLRQSLAALNLDMGGFTVDFGNAPYVASKYVELGILGAAGRFVG